jgi:HEAT repeat protein
MLALVVGLRGDAARAQQKGNDNASQSSQKSGQTKHVFVGRGSDTAQGSRVTIKSDNPLNDYSAYRSGDRFYVVLPRAAAGSVARGGAGKGYSDMQVQQRGDSVVLSYRVQPGAKPRVEQKFNRLDVVFDAPEGSTSNSSQSSGAQSAGNERTPNESEGSNASGRNAGQTQQTNAQNASAQGERRNPESAENARQQNAGAQNAGGQNSSAQNSSAQNSAAQDAVVPPNAANAQANGTEQAGQNSAATTEATPSATPAVDQSQVAQNQQPNPVAPITTTNAQPATATGVSFGTYVLNHWPVALIIALVVVGLGLIIASRRTASTQPALFEDSKAAGVATLDGPRAAKLKDAQAESSVSAAESNLNTESSLSAASEASTTEVSTVPDAAKLAAASALAAAPAVVKVGKEPKKSRKAKKKEERQERLRQAAEAREAERSAKRAAENQAAAEQVATETKGEVVAPVAADETAPAATDEAAISSVAEAATVAPVAAETVAAEPVVAEHVVAGTVAAEPAAVEPPVVESTAAESPVATERAAVVEPPVLVEQPAEAEPAVTTEPSVEEHAVETAIVPSQAEAAEPSAATAEHSLAGSSQAATVEPSVASAEPVESAGSVTAVEHVADTETTVAEVVAIAGIAAVAETAIAPAVEAHEHARDEAAESTELEVARTETQPEEARPVEESQAEAKQVEVHQGEAGQTETLQAEPEPSKLSTETAQAVAHDPVAAQAQARRLIEGEEYDASVLSTTDSMARQMVAYELLAALATRNFERRERARAAFIKHGYFGETARDLREAEAPAERASAARSLALVGSRDATPHLVAALEDPSVDVRRAAVEALGSLRDPAAIGPLEALIPRERQLRNGIPSRIIRNAVEPCRETAEQEQAAAALAESTAQAAPAAEPATSTELTPVDSAATESAHTEATTTEQAVPTVEHAHVAEKTTEIAPFDESVAVLHKGIGEGELKALEAELEDFGGAESLDQAAHAHEVVHFEEVAHADETRAIEVAREEHQPSAPPTSAIEHVGDEAHAPEQGGFEFYASEPAVAEERGIQHVVEPETVGAVEEPTRASEVVSERASEDASEWFEFDVDEKSFEPQPTAVEPASHVFEASSGETLTRDAHEPAAHVEETRAVEPSHAVEEASTRVESRLEPAFAVGETHARTGATEEKGVVPFDEFSTVPASIQQRLASRVPAERAAAINELSHVDSDEAFQQICAAFDDDAKEVRAAAARALYDLREDRADSFTRALREATPERRRQIGSAISSSGIASEAISQLTGESREKTYEAFSLLFLMAKAGEVQPLIRAIEGHPNSEVRLAVVKLLALSGQKEVLPAFRRLAVRGSLPTEVRSALMEAIYQISSSQPSTSSAV